MSRLNQSKKRFRETHPRLSKFLNVLSWFVFALAFLFIGIFVGFQVGFRSSSDFKEGFVRGQLTRSSYSEEKVNQLPETFNFRFLVSIPNRGCFFGTRQEALMSFIVSTSDIPTSDRLVLEISPSSSTPFNYFFEYYFPTSTLVDLTSYDWKHVHAFSSFCLTPFAFPDFSFVYSSDRGRFQYTSGTFYIPYFTVSVPRDAFRLDEPITSLFNREVLSQYHLRYNDWYTSFQLFGLSSSEFYTRYDLTAVPIQDYPMEAVSYSGTFYLGYVFSTGISNLVDYWQGMYDMSYRIGYDEGHSFGYQSGYEAGYSSGNSEISIDWLLGFSNSFLSMPVFGGVTLGSFLMVGIMLACFGGMLKLFFGG